MADPGSHLNDEIGYLDEGASFGTTPDSNPIYLGADVKFKVVEQPNKTEVQGAGDEAITFAREVRGARIFRYNLGFALWGTAYLKFIEYVMGVAGGGGKFTNTQQTFSIVTRKYVSGSYKAALVNGCPADIVKIISEMNKPTRIELEGPCQYLEKQDTLNFTGLQSVNLSDNTWPPVKPGGSVDPIVWFGGGYDASEAFKWGTDADYDNKPGLTEFTQIPKWTLEFRRNIMPIVGRITGADTNIYHVMLDAVAQQFQVSLDFQVPAKAYGALPIDDIKLADWNDEVVYVEVPLDGTRKFDLRNGKVRIDQAMIEGRAVDMFDVKIERFSDVRW